jgi:hypothetical protein
MPSRLRVVIADDEPPIRLLCRVNLEAGPTKRHLQTPDADAHRRSCPAFCDAPRGWRSTRSRPLVRESGQTVAHGNYLALRCEVPVLRLRLRPAPTERS